MSLLTPVDAVSGGAVWTGGSGCFSSRQFPLGLHHHGHLVCLTAQAFVFVAEIYIQPLLNPCYFRQTKNQKIIRIIYALL